MDSRLFRYKKLLIKGPFAGIYAGVLSWGKIEELFSSGFFIQVSNIEGDNHVFIFKPLIIPSFFPFFTRNKLCQFMDKILETMESCTGLEALEFKGFVDKNSVVCEGSPSDSLYNSVLYYFDNTRIVFHEGERGRYIPFITWSEVFQPMGYIYVPALKGRIK